MLLAQQMGKLVINYIPLGDTSHAYRYEASIEERSEFDCDAKVHMCGLIGLSPGNLYVIALRACFMPELDKALCSFPSEVLYEWTLPEFR